MSEVEQELLQLLKERSLKTGGTFRLASGGTSSYYIDGKMIEVFSRGAYLIGEVLYEHTQDLDLDAIGGLEVGAVPLTTAAVIAYHRRGKEMEGFWVRDKVKGHGTEKLIEGNLKPGARVALVDDVITQGGSLLKAFQAVREIGCQVIRVLALVDRLAGADQRFREHGLINYRPIFTIQDLGVAADAGGRAAGTSS
ncbi:MAG TPA: orotate phosphoribosyltransferase [Gemmataceae bacterium]|jgi:orotate phosphoribosyltransferase|nr:orotate phosphoribosyltransferase [Gemmataceae bacterium]